MDVSKLSLLSWALIANTTLAPRTMMPSGRLHLTLLPRHSASIQTLMHIRFTDTVRIVSHGSLILKSCETSASSDFLLNAYGHLGLVNYTHKSGSFVVENDRLLVQDSTFALSGSDQINISNSERAKFSNTAFSSTGTAPIVTLSSVKLSIFSSCNFTAAKHGAIVSRDSNVEIEYSRFDNLQSENGAALDFDGKYLMIEHVTAFDCSATHAGGAFLFRSGNVRLNDANFARNKAPEGPSIFSNVTFTMFNSNFARPSSKEIKGQWTGGQNLFGLSRALVAQTRPPTATRSLWPTPTPLRTVPLAATGVSYSQADYFTPILIASIAFVIIVIICAITAIIYNKIKRRGNTIYAGESETRDENEMGTVEIKSRYILSDVYSLP